MQTSFIKAFEFLLLLLLGYTLGACSERKAPPKAVKGVLDLRDWDFDSLSTEARIADIEVQNVGQNSENEEKNGDGIVNLDGEWEFYWEEIPTVGENGLLHLSEEKKDFINVPSAWNGHIVKRNMLNRDVLVERLGGLGYATYSLKVLLPEIVPLSFRLNYQSTAYKLFINGKLLSKMGEVSKNPDTYIPERKIQYITYQPITKEIFITLLISNYQYYEGGLNHSISIGNPEIVNQVRLDRIALDLFVAGILLVMGVYHLSLFYLRRDDNSPLYFGIFCVLISFRILIMGEIYLRNIFPNLKYSQNLVIEFFTIYLGLAIFNEFISSLYPLEIISIFKKLVSSFGIIFGAIVLLFPIYYFTSILPIYQIFLVLFLLYTIYVFTKAIVYKREGARTILLGFMVFGFVIINDILYANNIINTGDLGPHGFVFFVFSQAFLLTSRFAKAFHQVKDLSLNLERKIADRTRDLDLQKTKIENAFLELQITKSELESKKSQMDRIQEMSREIQKKSNIQEMLLSLETILWESFQISDFLLVIQNKDLNELTTFYISQNWMNHSLNGKLKNIPLNEERSIHNLVFKKKRSLFLSKLKNISNGEAEDYNRNYLGIEAMFVIPCIVNNQSFAVLSFADLRSEYAKDPSIKGVKRLNPRQREEIEQLVALLANPIFQ